MRKFNLAPQPRVRDLVASMYMANPKEKDFSRPWVSNSDEIFWVSRTAWSLMILANWQMKVRKKSVLNIWIPDYFCNAALEPLRRTGSRLHFYSINQDFSMKSQEIYDLDDDQRPDIFLLVHYFGLRNACPNSLNFSKSCGALLVEDAAHILRPMPGVGDIGDCVLYSPHKHIPIPDGAALVVRSNGPSDLESDSAALSILRAVHKEFLLNNQSDHINSIKWVIKRLIQKCGYKSRLLVNEKTDLAPDTGFKHIKPVMSNFSKRLLTLLVGRIETHVISRQEKTAYWHALFPSAIAKQSFSSPIHSYAPYFAAFEFTNSPNKSWDVADLAQKGLFAMTWPDLPPEVLKRQDQHKDAIDMKKNRFFLPVHSSLKLSEIRKGVDRISKENNNYAIKLASEDEWVSYTSPEYVNNLPQAWNYGTAKSEVSGWQVLRFIISDENGRAVAKVQAYEKKIPILGSLIRITRGPTMLCGDQSSNYYSKYNLVISELIKYSKKANWRILQCSFDILDSSMAQSQLSALGFFCLKVTPWGSGLIDLELSESELQQKLNRRWKRILKKVVKNKILIKKMEINEELIDDIVSAYDLTRNIKGFNGIESTLIRELAKKKSDGWDFNIFTASKMSNDGSIVELGFRVTIRHGNTTTDFLVDVNDLGRDLDASAALYWHAILFAKSSGCKWFDLGGLNDATPKGVAEFKRGLNAKQYRLIGDWRFYRVPKLMHYIIRISHLRNLGSKRP